MKHYILGAFLILCFTIMLQACSTFKTIAPHEEAKLYETVGSLENETCITIPRIYSGTCYDYCVLSGNASMKSSYYADMLWLPLDVVADTVLLPYTVYRQTTAGDIVLKGRKLAVPDSRIPTSTSSSQSD